MREKCIQVGGCYLFCPVRFGDSHGRAGDLGCIWEKKRRQTTITVFRDSIILAFRVRNLQYVNKF